MFESNPAKILNDLLKTPQFLSIHFEFNADLDGFPQVKYTISRGAYDPAESEVSDAET